MPITFKLYSKITNFGLHFNGENLVSTLEPLFLIRSFSFLQVTRTTIKARMSSNFGGRPLSADKLHVFSAGITA